MLQEYSRDPFPAPPGMPGKIQGGKSTRASPQDPGKSQAATGSIPAPSWHSKRRILFGGMLALVPILLILMVFIFNASPHNVISQNSQISQKIQEISQDIRLQQYDSAISAADSVLAADPVNKYALFYKGEAIRLKGQPEEALKYFDRVLEIDPEYASAWDQKGWAFNSLEQWQDAIDAFDKGIEYGGESSTSSHWYGKGIALARLGQDDEALSAFRTALQKNSTKYETYTQIGKIYLKRGEYQDAHNEFVKTIQGNPGYADAWWSDAKVLEKLGDHQNATLALSRAISLDPLKYSTRTLADNTT